MRRAEKPLTADGESPALLERELHYRAEGEAGVLSELIKSRSPIADSLRAVSRLIPSLIDCSLT